MKVSVALATYNGEKYILEQLRSILEQTRQVDEVVITDDCSKDGTVELVREFIAKNKLSSWHLYENESNLGYGANFFKAIDLCSGNIIFLSDQDDVWVKNRVEVMAQIMESHPDIGLLNTESVPLKEDVAEDDLIGYREEEICKILLNRHTCFLQYPGCVMCFKKSMYLGNKKYIGKCGSHDAYLWGFAILNDQCYKSNFVSLYRRSHSSQTSGKISRSIEKRIEYLTHSCEISSALFSCAKETGTKKQIKFYRRMKNTFKYRLEMVREKKLCRFFQLLFYLDCYRSKKSYLREFTITLRGVNR